MRNGPLTSFLVCGSSSHAGTGGGRRRGRGGGGPRHLRGQCRGQPRRAVPPGQRGAAHVRPQGRRRGVSTLLNRWGGWVGGWLLWFGWDWTVGGWWVAWVLIIPSHPVCGVTHDIIQGAGPHRGGGRLRPAEPRARCVISAWLGGRMDALLYERHKFSRTAPHRSHTNTHTHTYTPHT